MESFRISVRALAEFALEGGDLSATSSSIDRMQDGLRGHREVQAGREKDARYRSEVPVSLKIDLGNIALTVHGRIDGLREGDGLTLVEEIKTTLDDPSGITEEGYPVHWAQAYIYAHIIAKRQRAQAVDVRLTYYNLTGRSVSFTRTMLAEKLAELFTGYATLYADWLERLVAWRARRDPTLLALSFPYDEYRSGQRDMAANAYIALREGRCLLCQAPTGIGKTAAALFPSLKALGEGRVSHIFYLTARTTARKAAEDALERMRARGLIARSVTITAKQKICAHPGAECTPEDCPRARGYYDRRRDAMREALEMERLPREAIEELAKRYELCPFELSLDLSETADVILCDYNYAFDPGVKLKRFFLDKGDYALLVDEAHNLPDRAREFLSSELSQESVAVVRSQAAKHSGRKTPLYRTLDKLLKFFKDLNESLDGPEVFVEPIVELTEPLTDFLETAKPLLGEPVPYLGALTELYFGALFYLRSMERYDEKYRTLVTQQGKMTTLKVWCFDPSDYLRKCMKRVKGVVMFSATLTPIRYYADLLGLSENAGDATLELASPFPEENLCVTRIPVNTRYSNRQTSAREVAEALIMMCKAKVGNYIACFPSHAYLNLVMDILLPMAGDIEIVRQRGTMNDEEREAFLENFAPKPAFSMLAMIAMGGVFAEGIDLPGDRLIGAAIVGVGIPQIGFERDVLRSVMNDGDEGYNYAYVYPGIERVLQAAGRVIRTHTDRGCVLLIDDRFAEGEYPSLLPRHWIVQPARNVRDAQRILTEFWAGG